MKELNQRWAKELSTMNVQIENNLDEIEKKNALIENQEAKYKENQDRIEKQERTINDLASQLLQNVYDMVN